MKRSSFPVLARHVLTEAGDAELLERYVYARAEDAFAVLMSRYSRLVWGQCRHLLANEADAEDAFQATFLVLARSAGSLRPGAPLGPWLYGVAFRVCQNARRAAARRTRHERTAARPEVTRPVSEATWEAALAAVAEEVQALPEGQRAAFVLCAIEGRTESEAAAALGQKVGTISSRLARAKQALIAKLAKRGFGAGTAALGAVTGASTNAPAALLGRASSLFATGASVPGTVQSLTHGVTRMAGARFKLIVAGVMLATGTAFGAASWWFAGATAKPGHDVPALALPANTKTEPPKEKPDEDPQRTANAAKIKALTYPGAALHDDHGSAAVSQQTFFTPDDLEKVEAWYREKLHIDKAYLGGTANFPWPSGSTVVVKERQQWSVARDDIRERNRAVNHVTIREGTVRNFVLRTPEGTMVVLINRIPVDKQTLIAITYLPPEGKK